ncbi:MAG: hypothetical protein LBS56_07310 [Propionibacteriaceae bacterium]|nr:hypothetical protein [Propionibacteriaceae bacterium]
MVALNVPASQSWTFRQQIRVLAGMAHVSGRVWTKTFSAAQSRAGAQTADFQIYVVAEDGSIFETSVRGYDGINSVFGADGLGLYWKDGCAPLRKSRLADPPSNQLSVAFGIAAMAPVAGCDRPFNLFFDPPAADLPQRVDYWGRGGGDSFVKPVYQIPTRPNPQLVVDHDAPATAPYQGVSGTLGIAGFAGQYQVLIDVDGDGSYTGSADIAQTRQKPLGVGDVAWDWNGQDRQGNPVTADHVAIAVQLAKGNEYHQMFGDVEKLAGGIQIRQLAGYGVVKNAGNPVWPLVHWDDSEVLSSGLTLGVNPLGALFGGSADVKSPTSGVSTQGYKHAWGCHNPTNPGGDLPWPDWTWQQDLCWGNNASIDFGTWDDLSKDTTLRGTRDLYRRSAAMVSKSGSLNPPSGSPLARTVTYTLKIKNTSSTAELTADQQSRLAFPAADPLVVADTLPSHTSGWTYLSTTYDRGSAAAQASATAAAGKMTWRGPLKAQETATVTYRLTVTAGFEATRTNQAAITGCPAGPADVNTSCDKTPVSNTTGLPGLKIDKKVDTAGLHEKGQTAAYTVTVTNIGQAAFTATDPAFAYDDLTKVLDDAVFAPATLEATVGTARWDAAARRITWTGSLGVGAAARITYTVAYDPHVAEEASDLLLQNTAWIRPVDVIDQTPGERVSTETPGSDLHVAKSVDVEVLKPGQVATFAIDLSNARGKTSAPVKLVDHLAGVLDDADLVAGSIQSTDPAITTLLNSGAGDLAITGSLQAGQSARISYRVTVKAGARGDDLLVNRIGPGAGACQPDNQLCTSTPVSAYTVAKTSQTDSGLAPAAGDKVRYTVTIANAGSVPVAIAERDQLQWVLDDADVANVASDYGPITAMLEGQAISIAGQLEAGATAHVTYDATIRDRASRGDQVLTNVVYPDQVCGTDPKTPCAPPVIPAHRPACDAALGRPCTTNLVRDLQVFKTASPSVAKPFEPVDYRIELASVGTAPVAVDHVDVTRWIWDDAAVTSAPVSDNAHVRVVYDPLVLATTLTGSLAAGETAAITYQVKVKPHAGRGDHRLVNVVLPRDPADPNRPELPQDDVPNCALLAPGACTDTPVQDYRVEKSVDVETTSPGELVQYTLTFTNQGSVPADINVVDHLAGVLDDADLSGQPVADTDALAVAFDSATQMISVVGAIPAPVGTTAVVAYQVAVRPFAERGDHVLANFVTADQDQLLRLRCLAGEPLCTVTPVEELAIEKKVDVRSLKPGQLATFAVAFSNHGQTDIVLNHHDLLGWVLDDGELRGALQVDHAPAVGGVVEPVAALVAEPAVDPVAEPAIEPVTDLVTESEPVTELVPELVPEPEPVADPVKAVWASELKRIEFTGTLRPGESATISYSARVTKAGDRWYHNYVVAADQPYSADLYDPELTPQPPACAPDKGMICTVTPISAPPETPAALPFTGAGPAGFLVVTALGMVLGGLAMVIWRRQRATGAT